MIRLIPRTLFGQTVLVLVAGIGLALLGGILIWASDRREAVRTVGALAIAERIINVSRLVGDMPDGLKDRLVEGASDPHFRVTYSVDALVPSSQSADAPTTAVAYYIRDALPGRSANVAVVSDAVRRPGESWPTGPGRHMRGDDMGLHGPGGMMMHTPMMRGPLAHAAMTWRQLNASVQMADGKWLNFATALPDQGPTVSPRLILALAMIAGTIVLLSAWTVRRMTVPLETLAAAAVRLGRNVEAPALEVKGTIDMQRASQAFNEMQRRLRHLIENRTQLLAAISHDLRTQLTLLRLRAEAGAPGEDRDKLIKTIAEMEDMLATTLSFARDEARSEAARRVDLGSLVASIADDMSDAGLPVTQENIAKEAILACKPIALRRAITNLIDNAVKYGGSARVSLVVDSHQVTITVVDDGPGIPQDQIERVSQPFYRIETSRSRDTGGIGLGLAIASSIAEAHGGALSLANKSTGGLRVTLTLPTGPEPVSLLHRT